MVTTSFGIVQHSYKNTIFSDVLVVARSGGGEHVGGSACIYHSIVGK